MKKPSGSNKYSMECIYTDSGGFRITNELLERILREAKKVNKIGKLLLNIKRNDEEIFILDCTIKIKQK